MSTKTKFDTKTLCESAILLALSIFLSFCTFYKMPMGGSITPASMLPVLLIGVKHGYKWGLGSSFVFMLVQILQSIIGGDVFVYCETAGTMLICILFDYVVPFTILGLSAFAKPKENEKLNVTKMLVTFAVLLVIRFACHYITGVVIWGQWAENMSKYLYSLLYNGQYMLPELIITEVIAGLLVASSQIRKLLESK